ncbi:LysR family transcriptional regulator [Aestuariivirga litoralis]|uniref:LysR family transcriptional regulator n=1 Tax=Aestuariivirga litoralis TaxID=2650924 RepID=UPI0018C6295B|nr:LysR family transcriptional regulator [Aestuariivirga litoralis]MBG1232800.1 LysR family transcriptional regulator [Aestuariivirga litoralis]
MRVTDLSELAAFDAVARHKNFRRGAEERGVTASAISHAVSNLEARIGLRLLNRTTRSVSLTDAGSVLVARLSPALLDMGSALDGLNQFRDTPFGKVRINVPSSIAPFVIGPVLGPLIKANPNLTLEVIATDRLVDIAEDGFDAGIRLGESLRDGMTAVKIKPRLRFVLVGSKDYFKKHGKPRMPADLKNHICMQNLYPSGVRYSWVFEKDGKAVEFQPSGPFASDDHELLVQVARAGMGLAFVWESRAVRDLKDGTLVSCLESWCPPEDWLYLYYPTRKYLSAGLRAVIAAMRA